MVHQDDEGDPNQNQWLGLQELKRQAVLDYWVSIVLPPVNNQSVHLGKN